MARSVPEHFFRQSGVLPWRRDAKGRAKIAAVTNAGGRWILPKGVVEPELGPVESALVEAWEEAGLRGVVEEPAFGRYTYAKWGGTCTVELFLMRVTEVAETWPESKTRRRRWIEPADALESLHDRIPREILELGFARIDELAP